MSQIREKVAEHYNTLEERGLEERRKSRIFFLRNFNNWIKSMLIGDTLHKIKEQTRKEIKVLDIGCGKGGDLLKWKKGGISYLVCADIANTSIEQCEHRFKEMWKRQAYERRYNNSTFDAEFLTADCTKTRLQNLYKNKDIQFDIVSCQFAFHYCFESIEQVDRMLQNASECLRPGGYFIGTTPNSCEIIKRLNASDNLSFGNDVYEISFEKKDELDLFGAKYNFHLEEVVDCPEFLVYFPALKEIARKHDLELVFKTPFDDYFWECLKSADHKRQQEARSLLGKMQALETYPPFDKSDLSSKNCDDYAHVKDALKKIENNEGSRHTLRMGTLSFSEWEVITLYVAFAFKKMVPVELDMKKNDEQTDKTNDNKTEVSDDDEKWDRNDDGDHVSKRKHDEEDVTNRHELDGRGDEAIQSKRKHYNEESDSDVRQQSVHNEKMTKS